MEALLIAIMTWLSANFGMPPSNDLPHIAHMPADQIVAVYYGPARPDNLRKIVAMYDDDTNTILLSDSWSARTPADVSVIVHEMVHHLQNRAGATFECPQAREKAAYAAQEAWLHLFGLSLSSSFEIDPMTLKFSTQCMPY